MMQVPYSEDSKLFKMLAKAEPRLAKLTKYQVKYVERSSKPLKKFLFVKDFSGGKFFDEEKVPRGIFSPPLYYHVQAIMKTLYPRERDLKPNMALMMMSHHQRNKGNSNWISNIACYWL